MQCFEGYEYERYAEERGWQWYWQQWSTAGVATAAATAQLHEQVEKKSIALDLDNVRPYSGGQISLVLHMLHMLLSIVKW